MYGLVPPSRHTEGLSGKSQQAVPDNVAILNCGVIPQDAHPEGEYEREEPGYTGDIKETMGVSTVARGGSARAAQRENSRPITNLLVPLLAFQCPFINCEWSRPLAHDVLKRSRCTHSVSQQVRSLTFEVGPRKRKKEKKIGKLPLA